jgi:hypothetical protein
MTVFAIDPGYYKSAGVFYDGTRIVSHDILPNENMLVAVRHAEADVLVIEEMQLFASSYGVGREVFDSVFWSGRFAERWSPRPFERVLRSKVRGHLGASKGGDAAVRASLIDRFGPYKEQAIGRKSAPGPLYGIKADCWSALALAVTWYDLNARQPEKAVS